MRRLHLLLVFIVVCAFAKAQNYPVEQISGFPDFPIVLNAESVDNPGGITFYFREDGFLYNKNSAGLETCITCSIGAGVQSIVAGTDISVDSTDPKNPIVSYIGTSPPFSIGDAVDVNLTGISDGQTLTWNEDDEEFSGTDPPSGGGAGYFEVIIWAEESAAIAANQDEWSFGNGATGVIGIPSFWDCEAIGMVLDADIAGTSATVVLKINGTAITTHGITGTGEVNVFTFPNSLTITRGDRIGFRTTATNGTWSDVRVGVVLRVQN